MKLRTPAETASAALGVSNDKITLSRTNIARLGVLSVLAGAYISLGALLSVIIGFGFPETTAANPSMQKILSGLVFPIGLTLIVVLGGELFTGNNALLMPGLTTGRIKPLETVWNWTAVWLGNFVGALLFMYILVTIPGMMSADPWHSAIIRMAEAKVSMPWLTVFTKAIGANWCVCLAVWLALSGKTLGEKTLGCWIPVFAFVALGYEHCIANMFFIPCGMAEGADVSIGALFFDNLVPATLGNIVGGALLVGCVHSWLHLKKS